MTVKRQSPRTPLSQEVLLRRAGGFPFRVRIYDLSPQGCKVEFVERPQLAERIWIKIDGLEALQCFVCWIHGVTTGLEFERPIHPAVFEDLLGRMNAPE